MLDFVGFLDKIVSIEEAVKLCSLWRENGKKLVFTNGCFDILHKGHVSYLEAARDFGDYLIIGLNSDTSVTRIKGKGRPLKSEENRAAVLAALSSVDAVTIFNEDTPKELIERLSPDVLVKGADYKIEDIVGADHVLSNGGEVKTIAFLPGYSSSKIINKMDKGNGN